MFEAAIGENEKRFKKTSDFQKEKKTKENKETRTQIDKMTIGTEAQNVTKNNVPRNRSNAFLRTAVSDDSI
jgi:hypothetical protein